MREIIIGLLWHSFRSGNLGVGALSICNFRIIDEVAVSLGMRPKYIVVGNSGLLDYMPDDLRARARFVHFSAKNFLRSPIRIINSIRQCDAVFDIGEGDSFADIYGLSRLAKLTLSKAVTIAKNGNLVLSPQTIGPFSTYLGRAAARFVTRGAYSVVARDHMSKSVLEQLGAPKQAESIDVAFLLPYTRSGNARSAEKIRVGINVSGLLFHGGYSRKNQFGLACDYAEFTRKLISFLDESGKYEIHLVPHVVSENNPIEDDYAVSSLLKSEFPNTILPSHRFRDPIEAKSYISCLDFFLGARMHSTIAAFSAGVPVLPLAYSRKFAGLFESVGYRRVLDMRSLSSADLLERISSSLAQIHEIRAEVSSCNVVVNEKISTYREIVCDLLKKLAEVG